MPDTLEGILKPAEKSLLLTVVSLEHDRGQRWRKRQCHDAGKNHRDSDGDGELLVERSRDATQESHRQEHRQQHQNDRNQRAGDFRHGHLGGFKCRQLIVSHVRLDRLDDDDGVVHDQADSQNHPEHRQHVHREAEEVHADKRTDDRHRHGKDRDQGRAKRLQENENDQHHQHHGFEEGMNHLVDRIQGKQTGIDHDVVIEPWREGLLQFLQPCAYQFGSLDRIGARLLVNRDQATDLAVKTVDDAVVTLG